MFNNEKLRLYLFIFLAFAVLSSKHILIYNEETLVALSFFCFLFFVLHFFGNTFKESLNERSEVIREELQNFLILKKNTFQQLCSHHQKVSGVSQAMGLLKEFTKNQLTRLNSTGEKALKTLFSSRISNKLKTLVFSESMVQQKLQCLLSEKISLNVGVAPPKKGKGVKAFQNKIVKKSLQSLVLRAQTK